MTEGKVHEYLGMVWRVRHPDAAKGFDDIDTDQIIPAKYMNFWRHDDLAAHAFERTRPEFVTEATRYREGTGLPLILVGGKNFGKGSSREHAPRALIGLGICPIISVSFARIFRNNSIYNGLPVIAHPEVVAEATEGDIARIKYEEGAGGTIQVYAPGSPINDLARYLSIDANGSSAQLRYVAHDGTERTVPFAKRGSWQFDPLEDPMLEEILWSGGLPAYNMKLRGY